MKDAKWVSCKTCKWTEYAEGKMLCSDCYLKNKKSKLNSIRLYWQNERINDAIRDICKENGWTEFDNKVMSQELLKRGII